MEVQQQGNETGDQQQQTQQDTTDVDRSISSFEQAVGLVDTPDDTTWQADKPALLNNLAVSLTFRYDLLSRLDDLERAISIQQSAVHLTPDLASTYTAAQFRFDRLPALDRDERIEAIRNLVANHTEDHPNRVGYRLDGLGKAFQPPPGRMLELKKVDQQIGIQTRALGYAPEGDPQIPLLQTQLAETYMCRFVITQALDDVDLAISTRRQAAELTPDGHDDKPGRLTALAASCLSRFEITGSLDDVDAAIVAQQKAVEALPPDNSKALRYVHDLGTLFARRYDTSRDPADAESAISSLQRATFELVPDGYKQTHALLNNLATAHLCRFDRSGDVEDLDRAVCLLQTAVDSIPYGHYDKPKYLQKLADPFRCRFKQLDKPTAGKVTKAEAVPLKVVGHVVLPEKAVTAAADSAEPEAIDEAISAQKLALDRTPQSARVNGLRNLGELFLRRFQRSRKMDDLTEAVSALELALDLAPADRVERVAILNSIGTAYAQRCEQAELEKSGRANQRMRYHFETLGTSGVPKPNRLDNLGNLLHYRFGQWGKLWDIDEAIFVQQLAYGHIPSGHPDEPSYLIALGRSFASRFGHTGTARDIETAISLQQQAINMLPDGHVSKPGYFHSLGNALRSRFETFGDRRDIDRAVSMLEKAVQLTPESHPSRPSRSSDLGSALARRFERTGQIPDIDRAIRMHRLAVDLTPAHDPTDQQIYWGNLGSSYHERFERLGDLNDLNNTVSSYQLAVSLIPNEHRNKPGCLGNLGNSLLTRFKRLKKPEDVDTAISTLQLAVDLTPDQHLEKASRWGSLGLAYQQRFTLRKDVADIDKAISILQLAVELTADDSSDMQSRLHNLADAYDARYTQTKNIDDLHNAIKHQRLAVARTPKGHYRKPGYQLALGWLLLCKFELSDDPNDVDEAAVVLEAAARSPSGPPIYRFNAARLWGNLCVKRQGLGPQFIVAYGVMGDLLSPTVWMGKSVSQRYDDVISISSAFNEAAAWACEFHQFGLALEWLEQGRSVVWAQMLRLRTPMDEIREVLPESARELEQIAHDLERLGQEPGASSEDMAQEQRRLADRWETVLYNVRTSDPDPKFGKFMLPKQIDELGTVSHSGAVVVVNIDSRRCDALILRKGSSIVEHLPLTSFTKEKAQSALSALLKVLRIKKASQRGEEHSEDGVDNKLQNILQTLLVEIEAGKHRGMEEYRDPNELGVMETILYLLWTDVVQPVLNCLGHLNLPHGGDLPRVTWCLTGPLAFLPVHAAGYYGKDPTIPKARIFEHVVSSYTPSLSALIRPAKTDIKSEVDTFQGVLAVSVPQTPKMSSLPGTVKEVAKVQELMRGKRFEWLNQKQATTSAVLEAMADYSWIHLACHGVQNQVEPTKSAFVLPDGRLDIGMISRKTFKHTKLAFLSACQTALGDQNLPEEAVHLAAGMLMAGYRTVLATMWSISDGNAPMVAEAVYEYLLKDTGTDDGQAAYALHFAVGKLREKVKEENFMLWIPYIHFGV